MNTRRRSSVRTLALVGAALLALPMAALAQQGRQHSGMQSGGMMGMHQGRAMMGTNASQGMMGPGSMMGPMGFMGTTGMMAAPLPGTILARSEALGLSTDQVGKIEALQEQLAGIRERHWEAMNSARQKLYDQAENPDLNLKAYKSALRDLADQRIEMGVEYARIGQEARGVLTAEQRQKLQSDMRSLMGPGMSGASMGQGHMGSGMGQGHMGSGMGQGQMGQGNMGSGMGQGHMGSANGSPAHHGSMMNGGSSAP